MDSEYNTEIKFLLENSNLYFHYEVKKFVSDGSPGGTIINSQYQLEIYEKNICFDTFVWINDEITNLR